MQSPTGEFRFSSKTNIIERHAVFCLQHTFCKYIWFVTPCIFRPLVSQLLILYAGAFLPRLAYNCVAIVHLFACSYYQLLVNNTIQTGVFTNKGISLWCVLDFTLPGTKSVHACLTDGKNLQLHDITKRI